MTRSEKVIFTSTLSHSFFNLMRYIFYNIFIIYKYIIIWFITFFSFSRFYLFLEREGREKKERNITVWLPLACPLLGTWLASQARALTGNLSGNPTGDPLVPRPVLNPLSHISQGEFITF